MVAGIRFHRWIHERALLEMREASGLGKRKTSRPRLANSTCLLTEPPMSLRVTRACASDFSGAPSLRRLKGWEPIESRFGSGLSISRSIGMCHARTLPPQGFYSIYQLTNSPKHATVPRGTCTQPRHCSPATPAPCHSSTCSQASGRTLSAICQLQTSNFGPPTSTRNSSKIEIAVTYTKQRIGPISNRN